MCLEATTFLKWQLFNVGVDVSLKTFIDYFVFFAVCLGLLILRSWIVCPCCAKHWMNVLENTFWSYSDALCDGRYVKMEQWEQKQTARVWILKMLLSQAYPKLWWHLVLGTKTFLTIFEVNIHTESIPATFQEIFQPVSCVYITQSSWALRERSSPYQYILEFLKRVKTNNSDTSRHQSYTRNGRSVMWVHTCRPASQDLTNSLCCLGEVEPWRKLKYFRIPTTLLDYKLIKSTDAFRVGLQHVWSDIDVTGGFSICNGALSMAGISCRAYALGARHIQRSLVSTRQEGHTHTAGNQAEVVKATRW